MNHLWHAPLTRDWRVPRKSCGLSFLWFIRLCSGNAPLHLALWCWSRNKLSKLDESDYCRVNCNKIHYHANYLLEYDRRYSINDFCHSLIDNLVENDNHTLFQKYFCLSSFRLRHQFKSLDPARLSKRWPCMKSANSSPALRFGTNFSFVDLPMVPGTDSHYTHVSTSTVIS